MENVKLFLSQKSQFDLVEKIKNKSKKLTRAPLFQSSEDGKQEFFLSGLICNYMYLHKFNRATLYPGVLYVVLYSAEIDVSLNIISITISKYESMCTY